MKRNTFIPLLLLISASSAFADSFNCTDYYGGVKLDVTYARVTSGNGLVKGNFDLKSDTLPGGSVSGTFFNYGAEPDNFTLDDLDCTQLKETGYCVDESGKWLAGQGGRFNLTFGSVTAAVTCQGDLP